MVKQNDVLKLIYGATLRGVIFYQVVKVDKNKVYLCRPQVKYKGNQNGVAEVTALAKDIKIEAYAKIYRGKIKVTDENFKIEKSIWNTLEMSKVKDREHYYTD